MPRVRPEKKRKKSKLEIAIQRMVKEYPNEVVREFLEHPTALHGLGRGVPHVRFDDDTREGTLTVMFSGDGDAWVQVFGNPDPEEFGTAHRFRTYAGGGESLRVYAAALVLALAIKLDNETDPQDRKQAFLEEKTQNPRCANCERPKSQVRRFFSLPHSRTFGICSECCERLLASKTKEV